MTAKEELSQFRFKMKKVDEALKMYEEYNDRATKITSVLAEVTARTNKISDKIGENVAKMVDLNTKYINRLAEAELERDRLIERVNFIEKEPYRTLLYGIYIEGKSLEKMCGELAKPGYPPLSYDRITHLHGEALEYYKKFYDIK